MKTASNKEVPLSESVQIEAILPLKIHKEASNNPSAAFAQILKLITIAF